MKIPKYVQDMLERSYFYYAFDPKDDRYGAGYTISIKKRTPYTMAYTLEAEVNRLRAWVNRQPGGECIVIRTPKKTTHGDQIAVVTIWDPVMQHIEKFIHP